MKNLGLIAGVSLLSVCLGSAIADSRYSTSYERSSSRYEAESEVYYVEGRVVSAEPVYESYWYYRSRGDDRRDSYQDSCRIRDVEVYRTQSSNSAPAGAIIGGAIGAHVGNSAGRSTESTVLGAIAGGVIGSVIGNEIRRDETTVSYRYERDCDTRYRTEQRELIGYDVRYRYNGREFTIFTQQHPGRYVQLRVEVKPNVR